MRQITTYPYYEVNFLNLGDADCIILAYQQNAMTPLRLALVDAGNVGDADAIRNEIWENWHRRDVDLAVLTHPDKDHKGGFFDLLRSPYFHIREFWFAVPWMRHPTSENMYDISIETPSIKESLHIYNHPTEDMNLYVILYRLQDRGLIELKDACQGLASSIMPLSVVGPTLDFADRNAKIMVTDFKEISDDPQMEDYVDDARLTEADAKSVIDTEPDDTSATNMSSVMLLFNPGRKFLLLGDASRATINAVLEEGKVDLTHCVVKVPHHGSKHNLNTDLIDRLQPQQSAICCAGTKKHPNNSLVYWLSKYGNVYSTHKGEFYYHAGPSGSPAEPLKSKIQ